MLRLPTDENIRGPIIHGLVQRSAGLDLVRAVDVGLKNTSDERILEWAAKENRIVVTHDRETMIGLAYDRIKASLPMPGLFILHDSASDRALLEDLQMVLQASEQYEWLSQVVYLPFK